MHKVTKEILLLLSYVLIPPILYLLLLFFAFTHRLVSSCSWCENPNNLRWITNVKLQNERWKDAKIYYPIYGSITRASWEPCSKWQSISNSRNFPQKNIVQWHKNLLSSLTRRLSSTDYRLAHVFLNQNKCLDTWVMRLKCYLIKYNFFIYILQNEFHWN